MFSRERTRRGRGTRETRRIRNMRKLVVWCAVLGLCLAGSRPFLRKQNWGTGGPQRPLLHDQGAQWVRYPSVTGQEAQRIQYPSLNNQEGQQVRYPSLHDPESQRVRIPQTRDNAGQSVLLPTVINRGSTVVDQVKLRPDWYSLIGLNGGKSDISG